MEKKEMAQTEEMLSNQQKLVEEKKKIISDLNKIKVPISATVFSHNGAWTIRNIEFWKQFKKRDEEIVEWMEKFLTESK